MNVNGTGKERIKELTMRLETYNVAYRRHIEPNICRRMEDYEEDMGRAEIVFHDSREIDELIYMLQEFKERIDFGEWRAMR